MGDPVWIPAVRAEFAAAGVPEEVWVPIMLHESGANPNAENNTLGKVTAAGTVPEWSVGLFQINVHAKAVRWDGTRVLTAEEEAALAQQLKDPVQNAKLAAQAMGGAWAAVKDSAASVDPKYWPWLVGVRSGWPAGSVTNPCNTDYCNSLKEGFGAVAQKWLAAVNAASNQTTDIVGPYFNGVLPDTTTPASGGGSSGQPSGGGASPTSSAGGGGGVSGEGEGSGHNNNSIIPPLLSPADIVKQVETQSGKDFRAWAKSDGAISLMFFSLGLGLLLIVVYALVIEGNTKVFQAVGGPAIVKKTVKAATE